MYRRTMRTREWSNAETLRFYKALNTIGTDFALMLSLFPGRTRKDLKIKVCILNVLKYYYNKKSLLYSIFSSKKKKNTILLWLIKH